MTHTSANLLTRVIFSTKDRQPLLTPDLPTDLLAYIVSRSNAPAVVKYTRNQEQHHRKISFQEKFIAFLKADRIAYDARYIWE